MVKQSSSRASLEWQDDGTLSSKWTGLCKFSFCLEFNALQSIPILLVKRVSTSSLLCACLRYEHHYIFCVFGVAHWDTIGQTIGSTGWCYRPVVVQWQPSVNLHNCSTLELQVHWDATGTTLADASIQWYPSGNPVLTCTIGTHRKTNGRSLEAHWKHTGYQQSFLQWHFTVHWGQSSRHNGLPLDCHWITNDSG